MKLLEFVFAKHHLKKTLLIGVLLSIFCSTGCQTLPQKKSLKFIQKIGIGPFLFKGLVERRKSLKDLKSFARTVVKKNDRKQSLKQAIVISGVDSIRIDVLSLFNQPLGIFIRKPNQTFLFDPRESKYYRGKEALSLIERLLGIEISFEEFIPLVSGNIPFVEKLAPIDSLISEDGSMYKLFLQSTDLEYDFTVEIDAKTRNPKKLTKLVKNKEAYNVTWENFTKVDGYDLPHLLEWSNSYGDESLVVKLNKPVLNTGIKNSIFNLNIPLN
jgi:hypothetical protein